MKANVFSTMLFGLGMACLLVACESRAESGEAAFEDAKEARTTLADSTAMSELAESIQSDKKGLVGNIGKESAAMHTPKPDAWTLFQRNTEADIVANATLIHVLKGMPDNGKLLKRTAQVESDNTELRATVDAFLKQEQENRADFQAKVALSLQDISAKLDALKGRSH